MGIHTDACTVSLLDVGSENIMVKKSNLIGGANGKKAKGHLYMQHGEANPIANLSLMFIGNVCIDPHMFRPDDKDSDLALSSQKSLTLTAGTVELKGITFDMSIKQDAVSGDITSPTCVPAWHSCLAKEGKEPALLLKPRQALIKLPGTALGESDDIEVNLQLWQLVGKKRCQRLQGRRARGTDTHAF